MKFLLVDDHCLFLDGLAQVFNSQFAELTLLTADSVKSALRLVSEHQNIDLALIDLAMPKADGISFIKQVTTLGELIPIAVLSACEDLQQIQQALAEGALGFIPKTYNAVDLFNAINHVMQGNTYLPKQISLQLAQKQFTQVNKQDLAKKHKITSRQLEVLVLINKGFSNKKVAKTLYISEHTVKSHLKQLFQTLNCDNRISCIHHGRSLGLLDI